MAKKLKFPAGFLWGAGTSAHQVEGNNRNDWSEWEKKNAERLAKEAGEKWEKWQQEKFPEMFEKENYISGAACDHYNRYETDLDMAREMGHNAHRFSIEWSRIEPEEGKFDEREIEHYRKVILALRERGMEPFVTLWHWTNPLWLAKLGGPANEKFVFYFTRYAKYVAEKLGENVKFWLTLNEPTAVIAASYSVGVWPPQKKRPLLALKVFKVLSSAHNQAYQELKKLNPDWQIGFANILQYIEPCDKNSLFDKLVSKVGNYFSNKKFLNLTQGNHDFLAVQYYFHKKFKFPGIEKNKNEVMTDMGWEVYPEGIYHVIRGLKKYTLPIYVTENGLADRDDIKRENFIKNHLYWMHEAIKEGADVRGYFHWSLLDNFEWDKGFWPRFGLLEVDYKTQVRTIRKSALEYAKICRSNELEIDEK